MPSILNASTSSGLVAQADTSGVLQLQTASTTALTINASQNVGIGTGSPSCRLDVNRGSAGLLANFTDGVNANFQIGTTSLLATIGPSAGSTAMAFKTGDVERMRIDSSGRLGVGTTDPGSYGKIASVGTNTSSALLAVRDEGTSTGNLVVVSSNAAGTIARINANGIGLGGATPSSGMGITFPATQSASSDANTLDDYEEGTWTPTIAGVSSYSTQLGHYVKIGKFVYVSGDIVATDPGTLGTFDITSLPFTIQGSPVVYPVGAVFAVSGWINYANQIILQGSNGTTQARIYAVVNSSGANYVNVSSADLASSFTLEFTLCYKASA